MTHVESSFIWSNNIELDLHPSVYEKLKQSSYRFFFACWVICGCCVSTGFRFYSGIDQVQGLVF